MKTEEFLQLLEAHQGLNLRFDYAPGLSVRHDFHVTEFKNIHITSVDCGGQTNEWKELVIQLWEPPTVGEDTLTTTKVSAILAKVERSLKLFRDVEVKFEYSNSAQQLSPYAVHSASVQGNTLVFTLLSLQAECKGLASGACEVPKKKVALGSLGDTGCAPGSGCC